MRFLTSLRCGSIPSSRTPISQESSPPSVPRDIPRPEIYPGGSSSSCGHQPSHIAMQEAKEAARLSPTLRKGFPNSYTMTRNSGSSFSSCLALAINMDTVKETFLKELCSQVQPGSLACACSTEDESIALYFKPEGVSASFSQVSATHCRTQISRPRPASCSCGPCQRGSEQQQRQVQASWEHFSSLYFSAAPTALSACLSRCQHEHQTGLLQLFD